MPTERRTRHRTLEVRRRIEYGDFQTPPELAEAVCRALAAERPASILEPTCGTGAFLAAALQSFPSARHALGMDVSRRYAAQARRLVAVISSSARCTLRTADFFRADWNAIIAACPEPILVVGNPPWVTSAALGVLESNNHPRKENRQNLSGLDALTGKSNFDVSEWIITRLLEALCVRRATLAMLCKTAVAHKVLAHAWRKQLPIGDSEIRRIDAARHFGASVDACLLVCRLNRDRAPNGPTSVECPIFDHLEAAHPVRAVGIRDGRLAADVGAYERIAHLVGGKCRWRSGVKHDCAAVFELRDDGSILRNGLGERVDIEPRYVYPLLKSSQVASGEVSDPRRKILLTQRRVGGETQSIALHAPKTWKYLTCHADRLGRRGSSIYRNRPPFSVFGVGPYTFSRWKVAVSGFYKSRRFAAVGPAQNRPVVCDDTCYFLPCRDAAQARRRADLLNGDVGREFFSAFVFDEAKRPLTAEILGLLDLEALETKKRPRKLLHKRR